MAEFLRVDKNAIFFTMLIWITVAVTLIGGSIPLVTAITVTKFELLFVAAYFFVNGFNFLIKIGKNFSAKVALYLLALATLLVTSTVVNYNADNELQALIVGFSVIFKVFHLLFFIVLAHAMASYKLIVKDTFLVISAAVLLIAVTLLFMGTLSFPSGLYDSSPLLPFAYNIRYLGYICTVGLSILFVLFVNKSNDSLKSFVLAGLIISNCTLLIWLGGRGSLVSIIAVLSIYFIYLYQTAELRFKSAAQLLALLCLSVFCAHVLTVYSWNGPARFFTQGEVLQNIGDVNKLSSNRIAIWKQTIAAIIEKPWLGYGPEGYRFHPDHILGLQPHNSILQVLVSYGIFASLIMLYIFASFLNICKGQVYNLDNKYRQESVIATLVILGLAIHSLVDGTFYHSQPVFYAILAAATIVAIEIRSSVKFGVDKI
ncbi:O-antigen ligase family protein [Shewanella atlantica]|nr:O-antigen ligase family protein [Shewanella atlantica]